MDDLPVVAPGRYREGTGKVQGSFREGSGKVQGRMDDLPEPTAPTISVSPPRGRVRVRSCSTGVPRLHSKPPSAITTPGAPGHHVSPGGSGSASSRRKASSRLDEMRAEIQAASWCGIRAMGNRSSWKRSSAGLPGRYREGTGKVRGRGAAPAYREGTGKVQGRYGEEEQRRPTGKRARRHPSNSARRSHSTSPRYLSPPRRDASASHGLGEILKSTSPRYNLAEMRAPAMISARSRRGLGAISRRT